MSKVLKIVLCFSLYNCLCQAQILSDQWVLSEPNGCKLIDPYFQNGVSFTWDGPCKDNMTHGFGKLIKFNNGEYESTFEGNYNMGVREGLGTFSHKDGTSKSGNFINGQLMGFGTMKHLNGITYKGNFINYRIHGNGTFILPDQSKFEGYFVSDNPYTGKFSSPDGTISYIQQFYKVDTIIENKSNYNPEIGKEITEYFDSNWKRSAKDTSSYFRRITYLKENEPQGIIRNYYVSDQLQSEYQCIYIDYDDEGKNFKEGKEVYYFENGNAKRLVFYANNKMNGICTNFYENGKIYNETQYVHGVQNGEYKQYYPTGEIELKGSIMNYERIGLWIIYDEKGNTLDTIDLSLKWDDLIQQYNHFYENNDIDNAFEVAEISNLYAFLKYGTNHEYYHISINNLGILYSDMGHFEKALPYDLETLENTKISRKSHPYYGTTLNNLGLFFSNLGKDDKALSFYIEALENIERNLGKGHREYGTILNNLSELYEKMGRFDKALPLRLEALENVEKNVGKSHPSYGNHLNNLGLLYSNMGQYEKALTLNEKALEIIEKSLGKSHQEYGRSLNNLGLVYKKMGQYEKALPLYLKALENAEKSLGKSHYSYGTSLSNLGLLYLLIGQYEKALPLYLEALENHEKSLGKSHHKYGTRLNNLGMLYFSLGNYDKALHFCLEALENGKNSFGKSHPEYGIRLNSLGVIYHKIARYDKALIFYLEALENTEKSLGKSHEEYGTRLNNIGALYSDMNKDEDALLYYIKSKENAEIYLGMSHPNYGSCLNNIGFHYHKLGQYDKALPFYLEALENTEKSLGKSHEKYGTELFNLGKIYGDIGNIDKALPLIHESIENTYYQINQNFAFLSENEKEKFHKTVNYKFDDWNSFFMRFNSKNLELANYSYDIALANKGMILQSGIQMRNTIYRKGDEKSQEIFNSWINYKKILAKEYGKPFVERRSDIKKLEEQADRAEAELTRISHKFSNLKKVAKTNWQEIQENLSTNDVAIELSSFRCMNNREWIDSILYVANILRKDDNRPHLVYLCEQKQIDSLIERKVTKESSFINKIYSDRKMYDLIWNPIKSFVKKGDRIYFAPSGLLNQLNLHAISISDSTYLSDEYDMNELSTTAILTSSFEEEKVVQDIAIFGGIDFDASDEQIASAAKDVVLDGDIVSRSLYIQDSTRSGKWTYLNGTLDEAQSIDKMAKTKNIESQLFTGAQAIEERFKSLSGKNSPSVIHIATHGFFFPDPKRDKKKLEVVSFQSDNTFTIADNPMNRSGLLFAGGNRSWIGEELTTDSEDGILTAYEVSNMSLFNTELVVLSACETGLGDIKGSEGVYGLQRAFKQAGVRYLMMSLWKVPDLATKDFMTTFYTEYLTNQKPVREAFNATQKKMKNKYRNEPYKWGGFVLME